jgi:CheY-like chemotaxis protein
MYLTEVQLDTLKEVINIGVGYAASSLNEMVGTPITLRVPEVEVLALEEARMRLGALQWGRVASLQLAFSGPLRGQVALLLPYDGAVKLVALLTGNEGSNPDVDGIRAATLEETGNIILNGVVGSISNFSRGRISFSIPDYSAQVGLPSRLGAQQLESGVCVVLARAILGVAQHEIEGEIFLFPDMGEMANLAAALDRMVESAELDLCGAIEGVAEVAAVNGQQKGVEVLCPLDTDVPAPVGGDPRRLVAVLANGVPAPSVNATVGRPAPTGYKSRAALRLLLVEDNPTNQEVALGILEILGYRADAVSDGRGALAALAQANYDLVLMDCQLPDLDGCEATRLIRLQTTPVRNHAISIVAMTAHAMAEDREKCLAAGMNDYLSKPIEPGALERAVERWTQGAADTAPESAEPRTPNLPATAGCPAEFDPGDLLERVSGNVRLAQRVTGRFLSDMPLQLAALSQAVLRADMKAVSLVAHSIKGAAANVGAPGVTETARRIEQQAKAGDLDGAGSMLPMLTASFENTREALDRFCRDE